MENNILEDLYKKIEDIHKIVSTFKDKQNSNITTDLIKIEDAAIITGYSKIYLYELVHRKTIPFIKKGRAIRFDKNELEDWMRAGRPNIFKETIKSLKK